MSRWLCPGSPGPCSTQRQWRQPFEGELAGESLREGVAWRSACTSAASLLLLHLPCTTPINQQPGHPSAMPCCPTATRLSVQPP